jgi:hypothetical protein
MKKIFSLISLSFLLTMYAQESVGASEAGRQAFGVDDSGSEGRQSPVPYALTSAPFSTSAGDSAAGRKTAKPQQPPLNVPAMRAYLETLPPPVARTHPLGDLGAGDRMPDVDRFLEAHVYASVGTVLAAVAAENVDSFVRGATITSDLLARVEARVPNIFEGWEIVAVYNGLPRPGTGYAGVAPTGTGLRDTFDSLHTNIFGLVLQDPASGFRWACFNAIFPSNLRDLLSGSLSMLRDGEPSLNEWKRRIIRTFNITEKNLDEILPEFADPETPGLADFFGEMVGNRKSWADSCENALRDFLSTVMPHGVGGNTIAGGFLAAIIRAIETSPPSELKTVVKNIQYSRFINTLSTDWLVQTTKRVLHGGSSLEASSKIGEPAFSTKVGQSRNKMVALIRKLPILDGSFFARKEFLPPFPLSREATLTRAALAPAVPAAAAVHAADEPEEDGLHNWWGWWRSTPAAAPVAPTEAAIVAAPPAETPALGFWSGLWNSITGAFSAAATPTVPAVEAQQLYNEILMVFGSRGAMMDIIEMLRGRFAPPAEPLRASSGFEALSGGSAAPAAAQVLAAPALLETGAPPPPQQGGSDWSFGLLSAAAVDPVTAPIGESGRDVPTGLSGGDAQPPVAAAGDVTPAPENFPPEQGPVADEITYDEWT